MSDSKRIRPQPKPKYAQFLASHKNPELPKDVPVSVAVPGNVNVTTVRTEHYQGKVPPPNFIRAYEEIQPGFADRLLALTESDQAHEHAIALANSRRADRQQEVGSTAMKYKREDIRRTHYLAFTIVIAFLSTALGMAWMGSPGIGGSLVTVTLASVVGLFFGKKILPKSNEPRDDDSSP